MRGAARKARSGSSVQILFVVFVGSMHHRVDPVSFFLSRLLLCERIVGSRARALNTQAIKPSNPQTSSRRRRWSAAVAHHRAPFCPATGASAVSYRSLVLAGFLN